MVTRIRKIKNLGLVFSNYSENAALPPFKRFNLIFGWNGCGKTTLTRLFDAISGRHIPGLEYEIEDDSGTKYKHTDTFPTKIRVFNQEYIRTNVKLLEGRANTISFILGKENKEISDEIERDNELLIGDSAKGTKGRLAEGTSQGKALTLISSNRDSKFTEIAKTIGVAIGGNALRDYKRPQAEKDFGALAGKAELTQDELGANLQSAKQSSMPEVPPIDLPKMILTGMSDEQELSEAIASITKCSATLMSRTVESEVIGRLKNNDDISAWVEAGIALHAKHSSTECEYCSQALPRERIEQLDRYFNDADRQLKKELQQLVDDLLRARTLVDAAELPDKARYYNELQVQAERVKTRFDTAKRELLASIDENAQELTLKKTRTTEALSLTKSITSSDFSRTVEEANEIIGSHNRTTGSFEAVRKAAAQKLKVHYLSTIFDDVKRIDAEIATAKETVESLKSEIAAIQDRIAANMAKISSTHKACEEINARLKTFLGHQELIFVPRIEEQVDSKGVKTKVTVGYDIMRGAEPATHLSEGEKTAIAFVYFVVHLGDQDFDVTEGVVVIDDPMSSLDSNSLYQAFSFLKNAVKDATQVFILTHNFDFLKLLINWRNHRGSTGYFMIKNKCPDNVRVACLDDMDNELRSYESEYQYLFKRLKQMRDEQDDSIAKAYPIPNIARKVWETFLMFQVPDSSPFYKKMDTLKAAGYDEQKLDAIYKFTNDQSHITGSGFNPALVPETKKVVGELFEMMAKIAPKHFEILDQATGSSPAAPVQRTVEVATPGQP